MSSDLVLNESSVKSKTADSFISLETVLSLLVLNAAFNTKRIQEMAQRVYLQPNDLRFLFRCEDLFVGNNSSNNLKSWLRFAIVFCFQRKALLTWLYCFQKLDAVPIALSTCSSYCAISLSFTLWLTSTDQRFSTLCQTHALQLFQLKNEEKHENWMKTKWKKGNFGLRGLARISRVCFFEGEALGREPEKTRALKLEPW